MSLKLYFDEVRAKLVNVLENLKFNGVDVLTSTFTSGRGLQVKNVADPTDQQDAVTLAYLEASTGGAAVKKVNLVDPITGNVTIDLQSVVNQGAVSTVDISVPEEVYGVGWTASAEVPTKKDVFAEMENRVVKEAGKSLVLDTEIAKLVTMSGIYTVHLPVGSTVAQRIATPTYLPDGWLLAAGTSPVDLVITHGLGKRVSGVSIFSVTGSEEQQLFNTAAYNGVITPDANTLRIQSLATINKAIKIYIQTV